MTSPSFHLFLFYSLLVLSHSLARTSLRPKSVVLPVTKDASTLQYLTHIKQRTPLVPLSLTLDLDGLFLWIDCENSYVSSYIRLAGCGTHQCRLIGASPDCQPCSWVGQGPACTNTSTCWQPLPIPCPSSPPLVI